MDPSLKRIKLTHSSDIYGQLRSLQKLQLLTDVTLRCGNVEVNAHRCVLAASSEYFRACLTSNMKESEVNSVITLPLAKDECLHDIIDHIYGGAVDVNESNVMILLDSANQLSIDGLKNKCCQFLKTSLCVNSCLQIHDVADMYFCVDLSNASRQYICRHFEKIRVHSTFLSITCERLIEYLSSDHLSVDKEIHTLYAIESWIQHDTHARTPQSQDLLRHVRTELISSQEIATVIHSSKYVALCGTDFLLSAYRYHALSSTTKPHSEISKHRIHAQRDCVIIIGGDNGISDHSPFSSMLVSDIVSGQWISCPVIPIARSVAAIVVLPPVPSQCSVVTTDTSNSSSSNVEYHNLDYTSSTQSSKLLLMGGYDGSRALNVVHEYDLCTQEWTSITPLFHRRCSCASVVYEGEVYCMGGVCGPAALMSVEVFSPLTGKWVDGASFQVCVCMYVFCLFEGMLVFMMGYEVMIGNEIGLHVFNCKRLL